MNRYSKTLCTLVAFGCAVTASAVQVIDFASTNPSNVDGRAADTQTMTGDTWDFSDSTPLISGGTGTNTTVYGGAITTWTASHATYHSVVRILASNNSIQIQANPNNGSNTTTTGMIVWDKADFLNGASSQTLGFSNTDSFSVNVGFLASADSVSMRFVVNDGGTYYVSSTEKTTNSVGAFSLDDPTDDTWATISTSNYSIGSFSSHTFTDVQGIGLYLDTANTNNQSNFRFDSFTASAVPEPEQAGMILGGFALAAMAVLLRRRRKA